MTPKTQKRTIAAGAAVLVLGALLVILGTGPDPLLSRTFDRIYLEGLWGEENGQGTSGSGSSLEVTRDYRAFIEGLIREHHVQSVVDAGCGDWTFSSAIDWGGARYLGVDISPVVVARVKARYQGDLRRFEVGDVTDELPAADLLLCKDVLQHLSNELVHKFIRNNLRAGKYKWVVVTDDVLGDHKNEDIPVGRYRPLDLSAPPFDVQGLTTLPFRFGDEDLKRSQLLVLGNP